MSPAIKPEEVEQAAKGHLALEPIELEVRNLMVITKEWEMGSMLVIVVMMGMEVVVVLIIMVNLTYGGKFLLCLVQCHALVGRQILSEPPDK